MKRSSFFAAGIAAACLLLAARPAAADYTAILTKSSDVMWKGWGCSLAWWANGCPGCGCARWRRRTWRGSTSAL